MLSSFTRPKSPYTAYRIPAATGSGTMEKVVDEPDAVATRYAAVWPGVAAEKLSTPWCMLPIVSYCAGGRVVVVVARGRGQRQCCG